MINNKISFLTKAGVTFTALAAMIIPAITQAESLTRYLSVGMSGSDVSSVQAFLATDSSLYPQGLVTGYFGSLTKAAVSRFQSRNGISPIGRIGPATLPVINAQMVAGNGGMNTGTDRRAPTIGGVSVSTSASAAILSWNTDEAAAALVYYSPSPITALEASETTSVTIYATAATANLSPQLAHSATINGLNSNTTYYYVLYVKDINGNESVSSMQTFRTN